MSLGNELLPPCVICKKQWQGKDANHYVYHDSKGVVCNSHQGVMEWYDELIERSKKALTQGE